MGTALDVSRGREARATEVDDPCGAEETQEAEERVALASVLQELTVAALDLWNPGDSTDAFLDRVAERLGCYAAMFLEIDPSGRAVLTGANGIGTASRSLAIPPATSDALAGDAADLVLPYPELGRPGLVHQLYPMLVPQRAPAYLVLFFSETPALSAKYHGMVERLARILGNVLSHRDLLVRTLASQQHLDQKKTLLEAVGDASQVGMLVVGLDHELLFWNQRFVEIWGLEPGTCMRTHEEVVDALASKAADPAGFLARAREIWSRPHVAAHDEIRLASGRMLDRRTAVVRSSTGVDHGIGIYYVDVTEAKAAEAERERLLATERAARASAEEAIHARDEFLFVASHELRTPLTSMQLVVQSLQQAHARGAEISPTLLLGLLENVERQTRRLARLVDELLDVSRIQAGRLQLALEPVDLVAVCREVITRFAGEAARSGSTVELHAETPVSGSWDRSRIDQVVSNLLSNAVKYGAGRPIDVIVRADETTARLLVRDRGMGIAPEQLGRLFQRFSRAVSARHYGGLGLGLFIVREIVEMHGGTVTVESEPNIGSTFTVVLPLRGHLGQTTPAGALSTNGEPIDGPSVSRLPR